MTLSPHLQLHGNGSRPRLKYLPASGRCPSYFVCCKKQNLKRMRFTTNPVPSVFSYTCMPLPQMLFYYCRLISLV